MSVKAEIRLTAQSLWLPVFVGVSLRFIGIWGPDLWFDEVIYVLNSSGDFESLVDQTRERNSSPFTLPIVLWLFPIEWEPWTFRVPSAIAGSGMLFLALWGQRKGILDRGHALVTLWLLALNPFIIRYSQEVREYSAGAFMSMLVALAGYQVGKSILERRADIAWATMLLIAIVFTPQVSYGSIFTALALLTLLWFFAIIRRRFLEVTLASTALLLSTGFTWSSAASFQAGISKADYLRDFYPEVGGVLELAGSFVRAVGGALAQALGNPVVLVLLIIALVFIAFSPLLSKPAIAVRERFLNLGSPLFFWSAFTSILLGGSLLAWGLGLFPMGAIRQQIPSAPVYLVWGALVMTIVFQEINSRKFWVGALSLAIGLNLTLFPWAYGPRNEVTEPVASLVADGQYSQVIWTADPLLTAGRFYFPELVFKELPLRDLESEESVDLKLSGPQSFLLSGEVQKDLVLNHMLDNSCELVSAAQYEGMTRTYLLQFICDR